MISDNSHQRPFTEGDLSPSADLTLHQETAGALSTELVLNIPHQEAGLNPLVDAAARVFTLVGQLQQLKFCEDPEKLQKDLITEVNAFQALAKNVGYGPEFIMAGRYALCATLDDVIRQTAWGTEGLWEASCKTGLFGREKIQPERFFLILERIIHDPAQYIDLMELMYICLSLGFRGHSSTRFSHLREEQLCDTLYRQIRAYRGDFNRTLSPFPVRAPVAALPLPESTFSPLLMLMMTASLIMLLFVGLSFTLNIVTEKTNTLLADIGNHVTHEIIST